MKNTLAAWCLVAAICGPALAAKSNPPSTNVAWLAAASDADIERAFAHAKASRKPLLLYWGATWCPPCNQLKATLFNRQEFAAEARAFVAVHVDGDRPGAQRLGQRFKVSGYPTMVLFNADGSEITRLPGEVDAPQVLALMQIGLSGGRPVKAVLADALTAKHLTANEWRLLAFYSWETDETQIVPKGELAGTLAKLARASPADDGETTTRLWLKALAASDDDKANGLKPDAALRDRVQKVLSEPALARTHMDVLVNAAPDLVRALAADGAPERSPMLALFDAALQRLQADPTLSRGDRQSALLGRIELARLAQPKDAIRPPLPGALLDEVRASAARNDREITDGYERMAVVTGDGYLLGRAGLWNESDALLKANLAQSHSPYYLMSQLGGNAKKLGRNDEALSWFEQAWEKSEGPATRLQWGSRYLGELVDLAPAAGARIEKAASRIIGEAGRDAGAFEGRSMRALERLGKKLVAWNAEGRHAAAMKRLQAQLDGVCGKVGGSGRATCEQLLKPQKA